MQNRAFTLYIIYQKFDQINSLAIEKKKSTVNRSSRYKSYKIMHVLQNTKNERMFRCLNLKT